MTSAIPTWPHTCLASQHPTRFMPTDTMPTSAGQHLAYHRQQDRETGKYSEAVCTTRHHSRVRAAEKVAYDIGILQEIPKDQRPPQPPPRQGPKVPTEYARQHKGDRRQMSTERQDLAIRISFQAAAAAAGPIDSPRSSRSPSARNDDLSARASAQWSRTTTATTIKTSDLRKTIMLARVPQLVSEMTGHHDAVILYSQTTAVSIERIYDYYSQFTLSSLQPYYIHTAALPRQRSLRHLFALYLFILNPPCTSLATDPI